MILTSIAKITIYHNFIYPKENNYWNIQSIVIPIALEDKITLEQRNNGKKIITNSSQIPNDENNICIKAINVFRKHFKKPIPDFQLKINKNIPVSSGLGGGSSNGTAILKGLNKIYGYPFTHIKLSSMALELSRDSYFFTYNRPAYVYGIADKLNFIDLFHHNYKACIVYPKLEFIENKAYKIMKRVKVANQKSNAPFKLIEFLINDKIKEARKMFYNYLNSSIVPEYQPIFELKKVILQNTNIQFTISGTGPSIVTLLKQEEVSMLKKFLIKENIKFKIVDLIK